MQRDNHAAAGAEEHEETIEVDLDAKEGSNITRRTPRGATPRKDKENGVFNASEWEEKNRHVKKRLAQQARSFNQQLAEKDAEFNRQLALRDERLARLERGGDTANTDDAAHAKVMDGFEEAIAAAQEEGDSKKVAKLTRQMTEADSKFWAAKTAKQTGGDGGQGNQREAGKGVVPAKASALTPTAMGVKWAKANAEWFDDPSDRNHVAAKAYANALYKSKTEEGDDRDEPEFYEDIRRQVEKRFPEIDTVSTMPARRGDPDGGDDDDDDDEVRGEQNRRDPPRRSASLSLPNRGELKHSRPNRLSTITGAEQRDMRAVGLDPANNKHVMQYIASRNELEQNA